MHLVGQCEISHPVARPRLLSLEGEDEYNSSFSFDTISPTMSSQGQNVFFGAESKKSYERLCAPISRTILRLTLYHFSNGFDERSALPLQGCTTSTRMDTRSIPLRPQNTSRGSVPIRYLSILVGLSGRGSPFPPFLCSIHLTSMETASFHVSRCAEWPQQSRVLALCARKSFSVSNHHHSHCSLSHTALAHPTVN